MLQPIRCWSTSLAAKSCKTPCIDPQARRLFAAGLDVWYRYPTEAERELGVAAAPSSFPFQDLDSVVMRPHRAGMEIARSVHFAALLNAATRGQPMPHCIDTHSGY